MVGDPRQSRPAAVDPGRGQPPLDLKPETRGNGAAARAVANGSDMDAITSNHRTGRAIPGTVSPPSKARTCQSARVRHAWSSLLTFALAAPRIDSPEQGPGMSRSAAAPTMEPATDATPVWGPGLKQRSSSPGSTRVRDRAPSAAPDRQTGGVRRPVKRGGGARPAPLRTASDRRPHRFRPTADARPPATRSAAPVATKEDRSCDETPSSVRCQRSSWAPSP